MEHHAFSFLVNIPILNQSPLQSIFQKVKILYIVLFINIISLKL